MNNLKVDSPTFIPALKPWLWLPIILFSSQSQLQQFKIHTLANTLLSKTMTGTICLPSKYFYFADPMLALTIWLTVSLKVLSRTFCGFEAEYFIIEDHFLNPSFPTFPTCPYIKNLNQKTQKKHQQKKSRKKKGKRRSHEGQGGI